MNFAFQRGMGFVGLLILVSILTIMATAIIPNDLPNIENLRRRRTTANFQEIQEALQMYYADVGSYPDSLEKLEQAYPRGPYILPKFQSPEATDDTVLYDAWHKPLQYDPGTGMLRSVGPDQVAHTADDVTMTNIPPSWAVKNDTAIVDTLQEIAIIDAAIYEYNQHLGKPDEWPALGGPTWQEDLQKLETQKLLPYTEGYIYDNFLSRQIYVRTGNRVVSSSIPFPH